MNPSLTEFNPHDVPWQFKAIKCIRSADYSKGVHEYLFSGAVGSAKSILLAHMAITHCLFNPGANVLIGRLSMPALKNTILQTIIDHLGSDIEYDINRQSGIISFANGSKMTPISWSDKKYKKVRSYAFSAAIIEELTENETQEIYKEIKMRVGRIRGIKEKFIICATNPDAPGHWAHNYFIENESETRKVFYSLTEDNQFLDPTYIQGLRETLSPKEALRMLYGQWVELAQDVIYYNYDKKRNFIDEAYKYNRQFPIDLCFDFNIGYGKPMSAGAGQYINGIFHASEDFVVHGARTLDILEEMDSRGLFEKSRYFCVFGDAAGQARDTRSKRTDYDIIEKFLANHPKVLKYEMHVPRSNPPIRKRHNIVNSIFLNENGRVRFYGYRDAIMTDKGFRLSKLKVGGNYLEDDSDEFQHISTARGYWIVKRLSMAGRMPIHSQLR